MSAKTWAAAGSLLLLGLLPGCGQPLASPPLGLANGISDNRATAEENDFVLTANGRPVVHNNGETVFTIEYAGGKRVTTSDEALDVDGNGSTDVFTIATVVGGINNPPYLASVALDEEGANYLREQNGHLDTLPNGVQVSFSDPGALHADQHSAEWSNAGLQAGAPDDQVLLTFGVQEHYTPQR